MDQEWRGEAGKQGNGGLVTTARMKVCRQQGMLGMQSASNLDHNVGKGQEDPVKTAAGARRGNRERN